LAKINGLEENDIDIVEADLFNKKNNRKFDLVFSNGLIEHFENTQEIIDIHASYLNDGGTLYISLPNFRGLNGWLQKNFDKENYEKHYIECMNTALLKNVSENIGLKNVKVFYFGKFMIWLENIQQKSGVFQVGFKTLWLCFKVIFKLIPIETKWFSPYIVIIATK